MKLNFEIDGADGGAALTIDIDHLVIAGWTGRDAQSIAHHIEELAALGVPPPSRVPLFYRVASNQLSQADRIEVVGEQTSGEVEPFVFCHDGLLYLSIASDHTDRRLETDSVALSKQVCAKPVARHAWRLDDVAERWDELTIRSHIVEDGRQTLYQEGKLSALREAGSLLADYFAGRPAMRAGFGMSCGTLAAVGGIRPATQFAMELIDPSTGRRIAHEYAIETLPVIS